MPNITITIATPEAALLRTTLEEVITTAKTLAVSEDAAEYNGIGKRLANILAALDEAERADKRTSERARRFDDLQRVASTDPGEEFDAWYGEACENDPVVVHTLEHHEWDADAAERGLQEKDDD